VLCLTVGLRYTTAVNATLLFSTTPLLTYVLGAVLGHEPLAPKRVLGASVALAGVAVIVFRHGVSLENGTLPGDLLILGKPLGIGILSAALKKGLLSSAGYAEMIAQTTKINTPGAALATLPGVHAMTDVTGFGLAGHLLEICRGSQLRAQLEFARLPVIPEALKLVRAGIATGASTRNWSGYGHIVTLPAGSEEWRQKLLSDPQTSGGLLVACAPDCEQAVLAEFEREAFKPVPGDLIIYKERASGFFGTPIVAHLTRMGIDVEDEHVLAQGESKSNGIGHGSKRHSCLAIRRTGPRRPTYRDTLA